MSRELAYFKQLFFKNIQLLYLSIIVSFISLSNVVVFHLFGFILAYISMVAIVLVMMDYQYRRHSIDFYYALPISRKKMFWIHAITTMIYILVPICVIIFIVPPKDSEIFKGLILLIPFAIVGILTLIAITAFSNSRIDSILLCLLYPLIFVFIQSALFGLFSSSYIYGLDRDTIQFLEYIPIFLNFSSRGITQIPNRLLVFVIGFIIQVTFWIIVANYFVKRRQVEHAGVGNLELRRYQYIKVIATFTMFLGFAALYTYFEYDSTSIYNVKDFFKFIVHFLRSQFGNILVGFVVYLIIATIVQRKVDKVVEHIVHYILILASFLIIFSSVTVIKRVTYEEKIPSHINKIQLEFNEGYLKEDLIPKIVKNNDEKFSFESEEMKKEIIQFHQKMLKNRRMNYYDFAEINIVYNSQSALQLVRTYRVGVDEANELTRILLNPHGEFANKVLTEINHSKDIKIYHESISKKVDIDQKELLNQFILTYFKQFEPDLRMKYGHKNTLVLDLGDKKINFTIYTDSSLESEVKKLLNSLR